MDHGELEWVGEQIYRWAGIDDAFETVTPIGLAQRIFGPRAVRYFPKLADYAALVRAEALQFIAVRAGLPAWLVQEKVAHELVHAFFKREGHRSPQLEAECTSGGATLIMRPKPFAEEMASSTWEQLALRFETTQTSVVLRIAEITAEPMAVVTPEKVHARGPAQWDPHMIRRLARNPRIGVRAVRLTDDRKRIAVDARGAARLESA